MARNLDPTEVLICGRHSKSHWHRLVQTVLNAPSNSAETEVDRARYPQRSFILVPLVRFKCFHSKVFFVCCTHMHNYAYF